MKEMLYTFMAILLVMMRFFSYEPAPVQEKVNGTKEETQIVQQETEVQEPMGENDLPDIPI